MNWETIFLAVLGGGTISSLILGFMNRKDRDAGTYEKLSKTVDTLRNSLDEEVVSRRADRNEFKKLIDDLRTRHKEEIDALRAEIRVLRRERDDVMMENIRLRSKISGDDEDDSDTS